ncbi:MAG TPA: MBL fold metallo-hydrolase, partial [Anaeromyxobacteraceae bacterium]|nr:MBL fold metallo-hydrolase [Anaeromyxobacteraceae bacterium]
MLRLTFLGTSGAMPTAARNLSGLSVRQGREHYLFDCGEGTQRQMIRFGTGFDVSAICFTHFHADHYVGAIGFVRTLSMLGRERPLDVYGPAPARPFLDELLLGGTDPLAFEIRIHEVRPGDAIRRDGATLHPWATRHRIHSVGWVLAEDPRPGRFHPERAREAG